MRKFINLTLALLLCCSVISCGFTFTGSIWGKKSYDEIIRQFFVSSDGRYIALIGNNYHYVLTDGSNVLKAVLSLKQKDALKLDEKKTRLEINKNNDITGDFVLEGPFSMLSAEDMMTLRNFGVRPDRYDNVSITIKVSGRRYLPRYLGAEISSLSTPYIIKVYYNDSNIAKNVGKAAITPVAVGLDAVLLIGKAVLFPLSAN